MTHVAEDDLDSRKRDGQLLDRPREREDRMTAVDQHREAAAIDEQLHQWVDRRVVGVVPVDERMQLHAQKLRVLEKALRLLQVPGQPGVRPNERVGLRDGLDHSPHVLVVRVKDATAFVLVLLDDGGEPIPVERDVEHRPEVPDVHVRVEDHASLAGRLPRRFTGVRVSCRLLTLNEGGLYRPASLDAMPNNVKAEPGPSTAAATLDHRTLWQRVHDHLREEILSDRLPPGTELQEVALSQELGVSRGPVREALGRLAAEGLVTVRPRRGAVVHSLSSGEFLEAYQVREALEVLAVRLAVPRLGPEGLAELQTVTDTMAAQAASGHVTEFFEANSLFHETFVQLSGNEKLQEVYRRLIGQMRRYWR